MEPQKAYWPTSTWKTTIPQSVGMRPEDFQLLDRYAQEDQRIHNLCSAFTAQNRAKSLNPPP